MCEKMLFEMEAFRGDVLGGFNREAPDFRAEAIKSGFQRITKLLQPRSYKFAAATGDSLFIAEPVVRSETAKNRANR